MQTRKSAPQWPPNLLCTRQPALKRHRLDSGGKLLRIGGGLRVGRIGILVGLKDVAVSDPLAQHDPEVVAEADAL